MEITQSIQKDNVTLYLKGKLFSPTTVIVEKAIDDALKINHNVILDFKNVTFLASSGLRVLLSAEKKIRNINGTFKIKNCSELVKKVFAITGFFKVLNVE